MESSLSIYIPLRSLNPLDLLIIFSPSLYYCQYLTSRKKEGKNWGHALKDGEKKHNFHHQTCLGSSLSIILKLLTSSGPGFKCLRLRLQCFCFCGLKWCCLGRESAWLTFCLLATLHWSGECKNLYPAMARYQSMLVLWYGLFLWQLWGCQRYPLFLETPFSWNQLVFCGHL